VVEGQLITPTLRLVRALGRGGMGSVWVADHLALHTQVAVKFMYAKFAQNPDFVRRFKTEAIAAAAIKSPHVAQVFDHGITDEYEPYIVMELLEGEDLRTRLKRAGPLAPTELAPILTQAAKALSRAHALNIVHRDIKPDNVFLTNVGDEIFVKLLDFGIAKLSDDTSEGFTVTGNTLGTPYYMSPEQLLSSKGVDFRSDLWSLGVVAYQALTGARPFRGETIGAVSVAVNAGTFALPSAARSGLTSAIDAWMQRALQKDPAARFGSAREMAEAFNAIARNPVREVELEAVGTVELAPASTAAEAPASAALDNGPRTSTGPTLAGTAHTGTVATKRRTPLMVAVAGVAVGAAIAVGIALRPSSPPPKPVEPVVAAAPAAKGGDPAGTSTAVAASAPSTAAAPQPSTSASAGATGTSGSTSDLPGPPAPRAAAMRHGQMGRPAPQPAPTPAGKPAPAPPPAATPPPKQDTIGF
jgi:serine/threonine-protein kinase